MRISPTHTATIAAFAIGAVTGAVAWDNYSGDVRWPLSDWASLAGAAATVAGSFWLASMHQRASNAATATQAALIAIECCAEVNGIQEDLAQAVTDRRHIRTHLDRAVARLYSLHNKHNPRLLDAAAPIPAVHSAAYQMLREIEAAITIHRHWHSSGGHAFGQSLSPSIGEVNAVGLLAQEIRPFMQKAADDAVALEKAARRHI